MPAILESPAEIDYSQYLSVESKGRVRSQLKALRPYFDRPNMISFGGGYPHPSTWPVNGMTLSVPFAGKSVYVPGYDAPAPDSLSPLAEYTAPGKNDPSPNLSHELQYSTTYGPTHMVAWCTEHVKRVHSPPYGGWGVHLSSGNTDGTDAVFRTMLDRGDYVLVEEFAYPGLLTGLGSQGVKSIGVPMDGEGMLDTALDEIMAEWDEEARGGPRPKLLFVVPTCSNPSGVTIPERRKRDMYAVCRKWGIIIVEDDPYCFLQIRPNGAASPIVPSFLSMDTDGRVIRIDSFSKIVAPGSRLGFITGPKFLVEKLMNSREGSTQCPSGFSIAAIGAILRAWGGHEGFEQNYLPHISDVYKKRCLMMISLFEKYLPTAAAEWPAGSGGMFLWVRLKFGSHPEFATKALDDLAEQVFQTCITHGVIVAPSVYFKAPSIKAWTKEEEAERMFLRLSFSLPGPEEMEEGVKRLGAALKEEWAL